MESIDFTGDAAAAPRTKYFNFVDPGPLPDDLADVPGFVNDLADMTMSCSHSPNRTLAFAGALAMLAHLAGRTYTDGSGTRTNLYVIALAPSGSGKESPRRMNNLLAQSLGISESLMENVASGEALEDELVKMPSLLLQSDEIAMLFGQMRGQGRLSKALSSRLRTLYTSSGSDYMPRKKANASESARAIVNPHLTLFGTGVPEELLDGLTPQEIRNGLFGRCIILSAEDDNVRKNPYVFNGWPKNLLDAAKYLANLEYGKVQRTPQLRIVDEDYEARELKARAMEAFGRQRRIMAEMELKNAHAIVARIDEKISKLALLHAISGNPYCPTITVRSVEWAVQFAMHVVKWMLYEAQFHVAEGKFGKLMERTKSVISKRGGSIDRRDLFRTLHCDEATLKRLIKALLIAEEIEQPSLIDGKITYVLSK